MDGGELRRPWPGRRGGVERRHVRSQGACSTELCRGCNGCSPTPILVSRGVPCGLCTSSAHRCQGGSSCCPRRRSPPTHARADPTGTVKTCLHLHRWGSKSFACKATSGYWCTPPPSQTTNCLSFGQRDQPRRPSDSSRIKRIQDAGLHLRGSLGADGRGGNEEGEGRELHDLRSIDRHIFRCEKCC